MLIYILVFFICLFFAVFYVFLIWSLLKLFVKNKVPNPFSFWKEFIREWKKFWSLYLFSDIVKFFIESFILWVNNAIVMRSVAILLTFTTSWFFGWWRNWVLQKIQKDVKKKLFFWEYMWDTFASLIFWLPIYIIKIMLLIYFDLTDRNSFWYSVYFSAISMILLGRFGCYIADVFQKKL